MVGGKLCLVRLVQDQRQKQETQSGRTYSAMITEVHCYGLSKYRQQAAHSQANRLQRRTSSELTAFLLIASAALPTLYT